MHNRLTMNDIRTKFAVILTVLGLGGLGGFALGSNPARDAQATQVQAAAAPISTHTSGSAAPTSASPTNVAVTSHRSGVETESD